jgi:hypothetical protein
MMSFELHRGLQKEWEQAGSCCEQEQWTLAFHHLERAHILSQRYPLWHARVHLYMLKVGWRQGNVMEVFGQSLRTLAALLFSYVWVPEGNTGGANVSAFKPMEVPEDLGRLLAQE